jgi:hypothetical protein
MLLTAFSIHRLWVAHMLIKLATSRFQAMTDGFEWTVHDIYNAQTMCPYETVAYGYSRFCELFNYEEWQGFEYSIDLYFAGVSGFHSPTGVCTIPTPSIRNT